MAKRGRIDLERFRAFGGKQREATRSGQQDPIITQRARIRLVENQRKEARVGRHTLVCDEAESRGGSDAGPTPLQYFAAAIGF